MVDDAQEGYKFFYTDHLGSTRLLGDSEEDASDMRREYMPYGEALTIAGEDETPYQFTGKELDSETGLYYFGARYYDPVIGRWLMVDPLAAEYLAWSPFVYSLNNPVVLYDPNGEGVYGVQLGFQIGLGIGFGANIQIVQDTETNKVDFLFNYGSGAIAGISLGGEIGAVYSPENADDLAGNNVEAGAEVALGHGIGFSVTSGTENTENIVLQNGEFGPKYVKSEGYKLTDKKSYALTYSPGASADYHTFRGNTIKFTNLMTKITKWLDDNIMEDNNQKKDDEESSEKPDDDDQ